MKRFVAMVLMAMMLTAVAGAEMEMITLKTELGAPTFKADSLHAPLSEDEMTSLLDFGSLFSMSTTRKDLIADDARAIGDGINLTAGSGATLTKPEGYGASGQKAIGESTFTMELKDYGKKNLIP